MKNLLITAGVLTLTFFAGRAMYKNFYGIKKSISMEGIDWLNGDVKVSVLGKIISLGKNENWNKYKISGYELNTKNNYDNNTKVFTLSNDKGRVLDTFIVDYKNKTYKNI